MRYSYVRKAVASLSAKEIATATTITDVSAIFGASAVIGKYEFKPWGKLCEFVKDTLCATFKGLEITVETLENGVKVNRAIIQTDKGSYFCRLFGTGKALIPASVQDGKTCESYEVGYCVSDGEQVSKAALDESTGEVRRVPVIYVKVA